MLFFSAKLCRPFSRKMWDFRTSDESSRELIFQNSCCKCIYQSRKPFSVKYPVKNNMKKFLPAKVTQNIDNLLIFNECETVCKKLNITMYCESFI